MPQLEFILCVMADKQDSSQALLSNDGDMTSFRYGDSNIRFRAPKNLKRYVEIKEWDNGYLVVMADYKGMGITEDYIDLQPILENLYINPSQFLKPIKSVKLDYHGYDRNVMNQAGETMETSMDDIEISIVTKL